MRNLLLAVCLLGGFSVAQAAETLTIGQTIKSTLTSTDRISDSGGRSKDYQLTLKKGQLVALNARSTVIDPILILFKSDGSLLEENDDHGESTDALIVTTIPENGTYTLRVNSLAAEDADGQTTGEYSLRAMLVSE
ncbi:MAG: pre-peptidase C-terminal domain-containing protein [Moraxellaceae bacterium]